MGRWAPGGRERLQGAALQLFVDQGFERTTVAEIAAAAGLTERTFFRHFADKREVLFAGQDDFLQMFLDPVTSAPEGTAPLALIGRALDNAAAFFPEERRPWSRTRQTIIDAEPALHERELAKLAGLRVLLAETLRSRGVGEPAATLAAETAASVFHLSFAQWIAPDEDRSFAEITRERLDTLTQLLST